MAAAPAAARHSVGRPATPYIPHTAPQHPTPLRTPSPASPPPSRRLDLARYATHHHSPFAVSPLTNRNHPNRCQPPRAPPPFHTCPRRRLDLGRARAFADAIDLAPLQAVRDALDANLQQLLAFEQVGVVVCGFGRGAERQKAETPARSGPLGCRVLGLAGL